MIIVCTFGEYSGYDYGDVLERATDLTTEEIAEIKKMVEANVTERANQPRHAWPRINPLSMRDVLVEKYGWRAVPTREAWQDELGEVRTP